MRELGVRHVFVDPIERKGDGKYTKEVEDFMKDEQLWGKFLQLRDLDAVDQDCMVHGDFHTSSVMVKGSEVKVCFLDLVLDPTSGLGDSIFDSDARITKQISTF